MKILKKFLLFLIACSFTAVLFSGCSNENNTEKSSTIESNLNNDKIPSADDNSSSARAFEQTSAQKTAKKKPFANNILLGDWECKSIVSEGVNMTAAQYSQMLGTNFSVSLKFDNDGYLTYTAVSGENTEQYNTTFDVSNEIIATINNIFLKYNKSNDMLFLIENGSGKMTFERL